LRQPSSPALPRSRRPIGPLANAASCPRQNPTKNHSKSPDFPHFPPFPTPHGQDAFQSKRGQQKRSSLARLALPSNLSLSRATPARVDSYSSVPSAVPLVPPSRSAPRFNFNPNSRYPLSLWHLGNASTLQAIRPPLRLSHFVPRVRNNSRPPGRGRPPFSRHVAAAAAAPEDSKSLATQRPGVTIPSPNL
jgi:hypothetical protein